MIFKDEMVKVTNRLKQFPKFKSAGWFYNRFTQNKGKNYGIPICGIVGIAKMSANLLFNELTKAGIEAANYPFCTIEPNTGVVPMPDPRLDAWQKSLNLNAYYLPRWNLWTSQA